MIDDDQKDLRMNLEEIEARANAASPGPWKWWTSNSWRRLHAEGRGEILFPFVSRGDGHPNITVSDEDMAFIEHAREDVLALIAEVRHLKQQRDRWQALCETRLLAGIQVLMAGGYSDMTPMQILEDLEASIIKAGGKSGPPLTPAEEYALTQTLPGIV